MRCKEPTRIQGAFFGLLLVTGLLLGPTSDPACAESLGGPAAAPLDTLREPGAEGKIDPRYAGADMEISRKVLPDVQATTVPRVVTPDHPPRLDDPRAAALSFHRARQAAVGGSPAAVKQNLEQALEAAPNQARYRWWQSTVAFKGLDAATLVHVLPLSVRAVIDSPLDRGRAIVRLHQGVVLANGIFWTLLVAALYLGWWRHLSHDLGVLLLKSRRHALHLKLPLLLPIAFILLRPGWLGFLALMSTLLMVQTRGRIRAVLAVTWLLAIALVYPGWPFLKSAVPTVDPQSEVVLLDDACTQPPSQAITDALQARLDQARDPSRRSRLTNALAVQAARRGDFARSDRLFEQVLERDPADFTAMVGLANNTYYQGHLDRAANAYRKAAAVHPTRGEIHFNVAQVYFKKLFVPEATESLEMARQLGFQVPATDDESGHRDGYSPVYYPSLTATTLAAACRMEGDGYPALVTLASWKHLLGAPPIPLFALLGAPLLLAVLLIAKLSRQDDPRVCENCGTPVCVTCARVRDSSWLCPACGETADRARSDVVLGTLLKNRSRSEGMAYSHRIVRLGKILPGAGHLTSGRVVAGWFRLSLLSAGLFLLSAGWAFDPAAEWAAPGLLLFPEMIHPVWLPLPAALWAGWQTLPVITGCVFCVLTFLIAFVDGSDLKRGLPERYSLTPAVEPLPGGPVPDAAGAGAHNRVHVVSR